MKKPIYQMNYEEFKKLCWESWGIMVSCGWISDVDTGRVKDHRESEIVIKMPTINFGDDGNDEAKPDFKITTDVKFRRLRDAIGYISKKRKNPVTRNYFDLMYRFMRTL